MVSEVRKQSMAWKETDYSEHTNKDEMAAGASGRRKNYE